MIFKYIRILVCKRYFLVNRYIATNTFTANQYSCNLTYNSSLRNNTIVLSTIAGLDEVSCLGANILNLKISKSANVTKIAAILSPGTIVHGGSRWKCKDQKSKNRDFYAQIDKTSIHERTVVLKVEQVCPATLFENLQYRLGCRPGTASDRRNLDQVINFKRQFDGDLVNIMKSQGASTSCGGCSLNAHYSLDFSQSEIFSEFDVSLTYPPPTCIPWVSCSTCWAWIVPYPCNCQSTSVCTPNPIPNGITGSSNSWISLNGNSNQQLFGSVVGNFPSGQPISIQAGNQFTLLANQNVPELSFPFTIGPISLTLNTNFQLNAKANIQLQGSAFSFNAAAGMGFSGKFGASAQFSASLSGSASGSASPTQTFSQKPNSASATFALTGGAPSGVISIDLIPILNLGLDAGLNLGILSSLAEEHFTVSVSIVIFAFGR